MFRRDAIVIFKTILKFGIWDILRGKFGSLFEDNRFENAKKQRIDILYEIYMTIVKIHPSRHMAYPNMW